MNDQIQQPELEELILLAMDGRITDSQMDDLNDRLKDPDTLAYYLNFVDNCAVLKYSGAAGPRTVKANYHTPIIIKVAALTAAAAVIVVAVFLGTATDDVAPQKNFVDSAGNYLRGATP